MKAFSASSWASITWRADSTSATGETSPDATGPTRSPIVQVVGSAGTGLLRRGPRHGDLVVGEQLLVDGGAQLPDVRPVLHHCCAVLLGYAEVAPGEQVEDVCRGIGRSGLRARGRPAGGAAGGHSRPPVARSASMAVVFDRRYRK